MNFCFYVKLLGFPNCNIVNNNLKMEISVMHAWLHQASQ